MTDRERWATERHVCTADDPWTHEKSRRGIHPDAKFVKQEANPPTGDVAWYLCPHCKTAFANELPQ